jgi:hypothetical protein
MILKSGFWCQFCSLIVIFMIGLYESVEWSYGTFLLGLSVQRMHTKWLQEPPIADSSSFCQKVHWQENTNSNANIFYSFRFRIWWEGGVLQCIFKIHRQNTTQKYRTMQPWNGPKFTSNACMIKILRYMYCDGNSTEVCSMIRI